MNIWQAKVGLDARRDAAGVALLHQEGATTQPAQDWLAPKGGWTAFAQAHCGSSLTYLRVCALRAAAILGKISPAKCSYYSLAVP